MVPKQRFTGTFPGAARPGFRARLFLSSWGTQTGAEAMVPEGCRGEAEGLL